MKTAKLIRENVLNNSSGFASLYRLSEPLSGYDWDDEGAPSYEYVVVSAANVMFSGPETYIFGSKADGQVVSWSELEGSFRGGLSHAEALSNAGYTIV